jgi:hypothetical protein
MASPAAWTIAAYTPTSGFGAKNFEEFCSFHSCQLRMGCASLQSQGGSVGGGVGDGGGGGGGSGHGKGMIGGQGPESAAGGSGASLRSVGGFQKSPSGPYRFTAAAANWANAVRVAREDGG